MVNRTMVARVVFQFLSIVISLGVAIISLMVKNWGFILTVALYLVTVHSLNFFVNKYLPAPRFPNNTPAI